MRTPGNATYTYIYTLEHASNCLTYRESTESIASLNHVIQREVAGSGMRNADDPLCVEGNSKTEITTPDLSKMTYWYDDVFGVGNLVYRIEEPDGSVRKRVWAKNRA